MGEVEDYPEGTFCWVDLGAADVPGAKAFYGGLFGWEFDEGLAGEEHGGYTTCRLRGRAVAGLYEQVEGRAPGWGSYISVGDVARATARARELGASVLGEPFDVPGGGRASVLADPSGAVVSLSQPGEHVGAELVNEDGAWTWNELVTPDLEAATRFYVELFGWSAADAGGPFPRTTYTRGRLLVGGGHAPGPGEDPTPRWSIAFWVADADRAAARVQELGGRVLLPPMDIPVGRLTIVSDPAGSVFSATAVPGGPGRGVDGS
jgi:predicted enzyme related to lactoylglutathione lyase